MAKRFVRSWDVFDTLIARRCVHPNGIFDLMGRTLGDGFTAVRVAAESTARAAKQEISLVDIYDELQTANGWTLEERRCAFDLEISLEYENVIPIYENISRVRDGDIVVSDMYLPPETILGLLSVAGLNKDVTIFVSTNGKGDGSMWRRLKGQFRILTHTGDNLRSDFLRALMHGIPARLTETSAETPWERMLRSNGAPRLSAYVREMRLGLNHGNKAARAIKQSQIEANFPLLLLASSALVQWCKRSGVTSALMCSRDCILWAQVAETVARHANSDLAVEYFLTSRVAALKSSENFLKYASRRIKPDAVVVDLSMTCVSLAGLADRLGIKVVGAFVISWHQSIAKSLYGEKFHSNAKVNVEYLTAGVIEEDLEALNQALTPSIHDVQETSDGLSVTYASENRSQVVLGAIKVQHDMFGELLMRVPQAVLQEALDLASDPRLVFLVRECARHSATFKTVITKAQPGAALWNDPNGIILNLPYANQNPVSRLIVSALKYLLKPFAPPGSSLYRLGKRLFLILQIIKTQKQKQKQKQKNIKI